MVRAKQILGPINHAERLKLMTSRIAASRLTLIYFFLALGHCAAQVALQTVAHTVNTNAATFLNNIVTVGGGQSQNFTLYDSRTGTLESCFGNDGSQACTTLWQASANSAISVAGSSLNATVSLPSTSSNTLPVQTNNFAPSSTTQSINAVSTTSSSSVKPLVTVTAAQPTTSVAANTSAPTTSIATTETSTSAVRVINEDIQTVTTRTVVVNVVVTSTAHIVQPTSPQVTLLKRRPSSQLALNQTGSAVDRTLFDVQIMGLAGYPDGVDVSLKCVDVLQWPLQTLRNTQREDTVFVAFQVWVLGMSFMALLNESIPHTVAALLTHILATVWASFQIVNTRQFKRDFFSLTYNGACSGIKLLPNYWDQRGRIEIALLVLNVLVLIATSWVSWRIIKSFGWATFRRLGANLQISRIYKGVLVMSILLQLCLFFIVTSIALWMDQLSSGPIGRFSAYGNLERVIGVIALVLLLPWLILGWQAVRRESKRMMFVFLAISVVLMAGWASEFFSAAWRTTFTTWTFFALMSSVAMVLTFLVTLMGLLCLKKFGHDLPRYLNAHRHVRHQDFETVIRFDIEKQPDFKSFFGESQNPVTHQPVQSRTSSAFAVPPTAHIRQESTESAQSSYSASHWQTASQDSQSSMLHNYSGSRPFQDPQQVNSGFQETNTRVASKRSRWSLESQAQGPGLSGIRRWFA